MYVSKDQNHILKFKTQFNAEFETLHTKTMKKHANVKKYKLKKAYDDDIGLPKAKIEDLVKICDKGVIPIKYREYFENFKERTVKECTEQDDEEE